jgi:twinkle protein
MEKLTTCPECSHTRKKSGVKCLATNIETGAFFCHHCGHTNEKGRRELKNKTESKVSKVFPKNTKTVLRAGFVSKAELIKEEKKNPIQKPLNRDVYDRQSYFETKSEYSATFSEYFQKRGINEDVLARNKINFNGKEIMFSYFKEGEIVNIKYKTFDKRFRQEAGAEKILYGLDDIKGEDIVLVCEGEIDCLSLEMAGYKNCVSVPDGAPSINATNFDSKFSYLENCEEELKHVKKFIMMVDNDTPGEKLKDELTRRLGAEICDYVEWPEDCKDPNDVLIKYGKGKLQEMIINRKPVPIAGLFNVDDFNNEIDKLYENGHKGGKSTGWGELDKYYTVRQGELCIVSGIPSHGKSNMVDALMVNLAACHSWRFAVFSPENYPTQAHIAKLAQKHIGKPFGKQFNGHMDKKELDAAKEWLNNHFIFINPADHELTVDHIISKAKASVLRFGIKGMVIDPWNEIDHAREGGKTETEYISECLTKFRRFARAYRVHLWLIAHPTKLQKDKITGKYPVPKLYDICGSSNFFNKADVGLSIWRDVLDSSVGTELHIQKIRFSEIGKPGMVKFDYDVPSGRYTERGEAWRN